MMTILYSKDTPNISKPKKKTKNIKKGSILPQLSAWYLESLNNFLCMDEYQTIIDRMNNIYKNIDYIDDLQFNKYFPETYIKHIDSGGYGAVFKLGRKYSLRISFSNIFNLEWDIPKDIERILLEKRLDNIVRFINVPIVFFEDYILIGILQSLVINHMVANYIKSIETHIVVTGLETKITNTFITNVKSDDLEKYDGYLKNNIKLAIKIYNDIYEDITNPIVIFSHFDKFNKLIHNNMRIYMSVFRKLESKLINIVKTYNNTTNKNERKHLKKIILEHDPILHNLFGNMIITHIAYGNMEKVHLNIDTFTIATLTEMEIKKGKYIYAKNNPRFVKLVILQVLLILVIINIETGFIHNDLKPDNILISQSLSHKNEHGANVINPIYIVYMGKSFVFTETFHIKINDYDFSKTTNVSNKFLKDKKTDIKNINNIFGDCHFFFVTLFRNNEYILLMSEIFLNYYYSIIENRCEQCDKFFNTIVKNGVVIEDIFDTSKYPQLAQHIIEKDSTITHQEILNFITNKDMFGSWHSE